MDFATNYLSDCQGSRENGSNAQLVLEGGENRHAWF
jgi:hypothetical protein